MFVRPPSERTEESKKEHAPPRHLCVQAGVTCHSAFSLQ